MDTKNTTKKRGLTPLFVKGPTPAGQADGVWLSDEFPTRKSLPELGRRDLLKMVGGALALAGINSTGCRYIPEQKLVPFVDHVEGGDAGKRKMYASCATIGGYAVGVLVDQVDGRPVRIDGNPNHPASLGSLTSKVQAEILNLYDPDRMTVPAYQGDPASWKDALGRIREQLAASRDGSGVVVLSETVGSPSLARLAKQFLAAYPRAKWYQYEAVNQDSVRGGATLALGRAASVWYDFTAADVVVGLDADLLQEGPAHIRYSRDIAERRRPGADGSGMSRIYAFESHPMTLGMISDHRVRVKPSDVLALVMALAAALGVPGAGGSSPAGVDATMVQAVARDLTRAQGRSVVVAGDHQGREVHAVCHAINAFLGNLGTTVRLSEPVLPMATDQGGDLARFVADLDGGAVQTLFVLGGNPAYAAPADAGLADKIEAVPYSVYLGTHRDETAQRTKWQLPVSHFLEAWGDGVAFDGTYTVGQPLIEPLYDSKSAIQLFDQLLGGEGNGEAVVQETFATSVDGAPGEGAWRSLLATGFSESAATSGAFSVAPGLLGAISPMASSGLELLVLPDPNVYDGRYANNNWLQELPKPITNLTWDNALLVSQATADKIGVKAPFDKELAGVPFYGNADMVRVTANGRSLDVPVWVNFGQADDVLILHMGYGRTEGGSFAKVREIGPLLGTIPVGGFDANQLRTMGSPVWIGGVQVEKIAGEYPLANLQHHNTIDASVVDNDRHLIKEATVAQLADHHPFGDEAGGHGSHGGDEHGGEGGKEEAHYGPEAVHNKNFEEHGDKDGFSFYTGEDFEKQFEENMQWAMTIDLSLCTGCNACVTACQAENNIPTVEKDQVMRGREMHWIRIDRYYKGTGTEIDRNNPPIYVQPVTCMQCEQAPCEPVCPVAATVHSSEGINQMVYNRCVGTRYCSNNCPYKVRRFNFFHYSQRADQIPVLKMLQNPDVTVRFRGVMEKCTYCVQRISDARIESKRTKTPVKDGTLRTACQVACPTQTIIFGDMKDPKSAVSASRADQRNYMMLEELNTRPRTTYLSKITNPNPEVTA